MAENGRRHPDLTNRTPVCEKNILDRDITGNTTSLSPSSGPAASLAHGDDFDPVRVDVSEENFGSPLNDIDQLVDALPPSLALPVTLVQEQRLEELHPQL